MKILMLTPYLPYPPASGGQIRTLNLLKHLKKSNKITLISLYKNDEEKKYLPYLKQYCEEIHLCKRPEKPWTIKNIYKALFSADPFLIVRNFSEEAKQKINELLSTQQFDVIHAETFYIMPHIKNTNVPIFLVEQTIEYKVYQHFVNSLPFFLRPIFSLDILKLIRWERFYWRKALLVGTVSESDKNEIQRLEPTINPVIIPNGAGEEMIVKKLAPKSTKKPTLLFVGNFFWLQNTEAANYLVGHVLPQLTKSIPNIKLIIAGQNAKNKLKNLNNKHLSIIDIPPKDSSTVKRLYKETNLFLAPIFGPGGTRLKILAAMASGLPVISTSTGIEGLDVKNNMHVLIADTPLSFVENTKKILANPALYRKIRKNAYDLVREKYNWKTIANQLEIVYKKIKRS